MHYRRAKTPGATYFFTVVTYNRQPLFHDDDTIALLRQAFHTVKAESPFIVMSRTGLIRQIGATEAVAFDEKIRRE
ncbi:MAG: hypothetical protein HC929_24435 [Leptolyngbyaceae cyanobacterium SM2_5_2]|nr:hypothetical protein [Leptolyngbyaceae cyanobacterium SM2_5_2]